MSFAQHQPNHRGAPTSPGTRLEADAVVTPPLAGRTTRLPNLVIAGVAKAGTTSLFRYLSQHPDVCASRIKELRYFEPLRYGEPLASVESYAQHFRHCGNQKFSMEATPGYFGGGRPLAVALLNTLNDPRVIVSFRDPGQRCWSWYRFVRSRARIPKDMTFDAYLDRCEHLRRVGVDHFREHQPFFGLSGGCYDQWIDAWLEIFGERLRIEFFEDLVRDPRSTIEAICRWLDIDAEVAAGFQYEIENKTVQYKNKSIQKAALFLNRRGEQFFEHHRSLKRALRGTYYLLNRDSGAEQLNPAARERLAEFYAPHNERLAVKLGNAGLSRWPAWLAGGQCHFF
ncbi:MAG: sulfotransferase [Actinomycetota bacterium]|nr:sulfotransferase [Actinomycetota bacterium]